MWFLTVLFKEDSGKGLTKSELLTLLAKNEPPDHIPEQLRNAYGNFGYQFTLSRNFDEVMVVLEQQNWVQRTVAGKAMPMGMPG